MTMQEKYLFLIRIGITNYLFLFHLVLFTNIVVVFIFLRKCKNQSSTRSKYNHMRNIHFVLLTPEVQQY